MTFSFLSGKFVETNCHSLGDSKVFPSTGCFFGCSKYWIGNQNEWIKLCSQKYSHKYFHFLVLRDKLDTSVKSIISYDAFSYVRLECKNLIYSFKNSWFLLKGETFHQTFSSIISLPFSLTLSLILFLSLSQFICLSIHLSIFLKHETLVCISRRGGSCYFLFFLLSSFFVFISSFSFLFLLSFLFFLPS